MADVPEKSGAHLTGRDSGWAVGDETIEPGPTQDTADGDSQVANPAVEVANEAIAVGSEGQPPRGQDDSIADTAGEGQEDPDQGVPSAEERSEIGGELEGENPAAVGEDGGPDYLDPSDGGERGAATVATDEAANGLEDESKDNLYEEAQRLDIEGRSDMTKDELVAAVRKARSA
jgi:hypothetical protein